MGDQARGVNCSQGPVLSPEVPKNETHVENIALTVAKPASKFAASPVPDPLLLSVDQNANCTHDGLTAHCGGSHSEPPDHVAPVHDPTVGDAPRKSGEPTRNDEYALQHGSRTPEPTNDVTKPHVPRKPSAGCPRFNWRFNANRSSPVRPAPKAPPAALMPRLQDVNSLAMSSQRVSQALQRQNESTVPETATVVSSRVTNWQVLEESEEEVIVDIDGRRMEVSPAVPVLPVSSAPRAAAQMTIGDWGQVRIGWGKKHNRDPGYFQWANARYGSLSPEIQDFVRYCRVQQDLEQHA